jgi:hypothetical protein
MKIKAFENKVKMKDRTTYLYKQYVYNKYEFSTNYTQLEYVYGDYNHTIRYSKEGKEGVSLQQAQAMLKVLDIELYEVKEINTFAEFNKFLSETRLAYNPAEDDEEERCFAEFIKGQDNDMFEVKVWLSISDVEEKYNVKLNILRDYPCS